MTARPRPEERVPSGTMSRLELRLTQLIAEHDGVPMEAVTTEYIREQRKKLYKQFEFEPL
jgi:hypothetical protein